jgi:hypothetical protein
MDEGCYSVFIIIEIPIFPNSQQKCFFSFSHDHYNIFIILFMCSDIVWHTMITSSVLLLLILQINIQKKFFQFIIEKFDLKVKYSLYNKRLLM